MHSFASFSPPHTSTPPTQAACLYEEQNLPPIFYEDCYLLDLTADGAFLSFRAPLRAAPEPNVLYAGMTHTEWQEARSYLLSFANKPLVTTADGRLCILLPFLAGTASLGILLFPHMEATRFLALARGDHETWSFSAALSATPTRVSAKTEAYLPQYRQIREEIELCFGSMEARWTKRKHRPLEELLQEQVHRLSWFCGVPVTLHVTEEAVPTADSLDFGLFSSFVLTMLLLARQTALLREAEISLSLRESDCMLSVYLLPAKLPPLPSSELLFWEGIAARKHILFEYTWLPSEISARFCPISPDWSYLNLKQSELTQDGSAPL